MTENGLILSRLKRDYAAFSFGEERLSEEERVSEPVDVSEFYFVVEYEVCGSAENFFNDKIYKLTYRYHTTDTNTLVDEILDINAFFNKVRGNTQPEVIESTENKLTTSYLLGIGSINNVVFKNTLSKNVQYIDVSVTADSVCNSSNWLCVVISQIISNPIIFLLGHSDVRTTEIYLDEKQELELEADMLADMEGEYRGGDRGGDALQKL